MDKWDQLEGVTDGIKEDLRRIEQGLDVQIKGWKPLQEGYDMGYDDWDQPTGVEFREPVLPKRDSQVEIQAAVSMTYKVKDEVVGHAGEDIKCVRMTCKIVDQTVTTEHVARQIFLRSMAPTRSAAGRPRAMPNVRYSSRVKRWTSGPPRARRCRLSPT